MCKRGHAASRPDGRGEAKTLSTSPSRAATVCQPPAALSVVDADDAGPPAVVAGFNGVNNGVNGISTVTLHLTRFRISLPNGDVRNSPTQRRSRLY